MELPALGFGTYCIRGEAATQAVLTAIRCGYRLIDTAASYRNEREVGLAIAACGVPREELFVTTKLDPKDLKGASSVRDAFERSRAALNLAVVDCFMMHWPAAAGLPPDDPKHAAIRRECWLAMEELRQQGRVRYLGVSNFRPVHLQSLPTQPWINQIELHPMCRQEETVDYCRHQGIKVQAYSPLGCGAVLANSCIAEAQRQHQVLHGRSPAELALWVGFGRGYDSYIPRSVNPTHIEANLAALQRWRDLMVTSSASADDEIAGDALAAARSLSAMFDEQRRAVGGDTHYCWHSDKVVW